MSIAGIGTDLVEIARVRHALARHGDRFAERILTAAEQVPMRNSADPAALLARRFAAKEAAAKALGCGIGGEAGFHELVIGHDTAGAPRLVFTGNAAERAQRLGVTQTHLTISDERAYALAFVILERSGLDPATGHSVDHSVGSAAGARIGFPSRSR